MSRLLESEKLDLTPSGFMAGEKSRGGTQAMATAAIVAVLGMAIVLTGLVISPHQNSRAAIDQIRAELTMRPATLAKQL